MFCFVECATTRVRVLTVSLGVANIPGLKRTVNCVYIKAYLYNFVKYYAIVQHLGNT